MKNEIKLEHRKCVPCERGGKPLGREQIDEFLQQIKGWNLVEEDTRKNSEGKNHFKLRKNLQFLDFKHALGFVNEIGDIAEHEGHHPDITIHDWNKVTFTLWTHSMKGLSENDFIMAAKIDQTLAESVDPSS